MSDLPPDQAVPREPTGSPATPAAGPVAAPPWASVAPQAGAWAPPASPAPAPGWSAPASPAPARTAPAFQFNRERWLPSIVVASIIACVVLGGIGLDQVIAAPSAGTVTVGGSVTITAAPGWVLASPPGDTSSGIELEKADAVLTAQVVSSNFTGGSASMLSGQEQSLSGDSSQISYGDAHQTTVGGHDTTYVAFEATVASGQHGILDGELVCMVVNDNAVVIVAGAPQGDLDPIIDDIAAMLKSVGAGQ